jgi:hypothetical protein
LINSVFFVTITKMKKCFSIRNEKMKQSCKLCGEEGELKDSHIIPKFVFKWMKKTGGNFFRIVLNPNLRPQDGFKQKLLCIKCEQRFSHCEKWFSENIFYPYLETNNNVIHYTNELGKFIISVLWRILLVTEDQQDNEKQRVLLNETFDDWKDFLLGKRAKIKCENIHLIFIPDDFGMEHQPNEYISRYFYRVTDGGVIRIDDSLFVFAKFSRFFLFAELEKNGINFRGTEISMNSGITMPNQFIVNEHISMFFMNRANQLYSFMANNTSEKQQKLINNSIASNITELLKSDLGKRIKSDFQTEVHQNGFYFVFTYSCDCCNNLLEAPEGFLLRTFEVIKSIEFWKLIFNAQNLGKDEVGLSKRIEAFKRISTDPSPWVICNNCISTFEVDLEVNKAFMHEWIEKKGNYLPPKCNDVKNYLNQEEIEKILIGIVTI